MLHQNFRGEKMNYENTSIRKVIEQRKKIRIIPSVEGMSLPEVISRVEEVAGKSIDPLLIKAASCQWHP